jgi:hypothetical protein
MMQGMLGVFAELDSTVEAIEELKHKHKAHGHGGH